MIPFPRAATLCASLSAAALGLSLAGCGGHPAAGPFLGCAPAGAPLAMAVGARANSPSPDISAEGALINGAARARKRITLIRIDGSPQPAYGGAFTTTDTTSGAVQNDLNTYLARIEAVFTGPIHARAGGADVLGALTMAAQSTSPGGNVVVIDSGLQTVAPLDFRKGGLLAASPGDVVTFLRKQHLLPDLNGRHVILAGFGNTAAPQPRLDLAQRRNVADIWRQIALAAGAACVRLDTHPNGSPAVTGVPPVAIVPVPKPPTIRACGTTILNADNHVNFVANKAIFIDPGGARATLAQLADKLRNGGQRVELIGSTATWGPVESRIVLSERRAAAVKRELVSLGIAASRIHTQGDGSSWPGRVPDIGAGGVLLPGPAAADRAVIAQLTCPAG